MSSEEKITEEVVIIKKKEISKEDEYFAREDRELIARGRQEKLHHDAEAQEQQARAVAKGRCPHCGARLHKETIESIEVDRCPEDRGVWLNQDNLTEIVGHHEGVLNKLFNKFKV